MLCRVIRACFAISSTTSCRHTSLNLFDLQRRELIICKFRQLRRAEHRLVAHQQRRRDFGVVVRLAGVHIEHELPERAFEPRQAFLQNNKARAGELGRGLEIHLAERFAKLEMLLRRERVVALGPETMMLDIVVRVLAVGHFVERQIGNFGERVVELFGRLASLPPPSPESIPSAPRLRPAAPSAFSSSLAFFASPISFDAAFRRACAVSAAWIAARRFSSSAISRSACGSSPRRAKRAVESLGIFADEADVVHAVRHPDARHGRDLIPAMPRLSPFEAARSDVDARDEPDGMTNQSPDNTPQSLRGLGGAAAAAAARSAAARFSTQRTDQIEPS